MLNLLLSILIKSKTISKKPIFELKLDISDPIIYILLHNSKIELLTLRNQCLEHNLPDPLEPFIVNNIKLPRYIFIYSKSYLPTCYTLEKKSAKLFHKYLDLHYDNFDLDIQIILVSVMFGRHPKYEKNKSKNQPLYIIPNNVRKFFAIIWLGRDSFVHFSYPISMRRIIKKCSTNKTIFIYKLARIAHIYFIRQHLITIGPYLLNKRDLFNRLLVSRTISRAIEDEVRNKKICYKKAQQNALSLMKEITANFSYDILRLTDRILSLTWNYLYQKINIYNIERVYKSVYNGHKIVYIPCHRSHMDYLLLSYVIYHKGLVPPHIAAGINLNFWPTGPIFRRLGAFFIRRNFKGKKLYSAIFREYLSELFNRGYSIEYFIEGRRSRTGRLLNPKTGVLSVTIQAMLRDIAHPITLVPIYIGYECIIEISSYIKELLGATKEKESLLKILYSLSKLHNLGQGYINFGKPLSLASWFNQHIPGWYKSINPIEIIRPSWLGPMINDIAIDLMVRINKASVVNAMNLCCTALLASSQRLLTREQLIKQLECYLNLMHNVPYAKDSIIPSITASELIDNVLQTSKFRVEKSVIGDIIILPRDQEVLMTYYRNNIEHMLVLPSLIAAVIIQHHCLSYQELLFYIKTLYPILKAELFLRWHSNELAIEIDKLIRELSRQKLIILEENKLLINSLHFYTLKLLSAGVREILHRYAVIFWFLSKNPFINHNVLEKKYCILVQHLSLLYGVNSLEFFDKELFNTIIFTLRSEGYISNNSRTSSKEIMKVYQMIARLVTLDVRLIIEKNNS